MTTLVFLLLASFISLGQSSQYDCRRPQQSCLNSGVCSYTGPVCGSCGLFEGYNCGLETAKKDAAPCDGTNCVNGGSCFEDAGAAKCYCLQENYGATCAEKRYGLECKVDRMVLGANPDTDAAFTGIAYIEGKRDTAACVAVAVPAVDPADNIPDTWLGFVIEVEHTSADCGAITATSDGAGKTTYTRKMVLQYDSNLVTSLDDVVEAKCVFDEAGVLVDSSVTRVDIADFANLNAETAENTFSPVTFAVNSGVNPVVSTTPLVIGSEIVFTFSVPAEYAAVRVESGEANNADDANLKTLQLVTGSCMDDDAFHVTVEAPTQGATVREVTIKIKAFHFPGNNEVTFKFTVKACLVAADCPAVICTDGTSQLGRKKREISNGRSNQTTVSRLVTVMDPEEYMEYEEQKRAEKECQTSGAMTTALIAMGIVIFSLLTICIILLVKAFLSRNSRSQSKQDLYSAQSVQSLPRI